MLTRARHDANALGARHTRIGACPAHAYDDCPACWGPHCAICGRYPRAAKRAALQAYRAGYRDLDVRWTVRQRIGIQLRNVRTYIPGSRERRYALHG